MEENRKINMEELCEMWMRHIGGTVKESTIVKYGNVLRTHILPEFGPRELSTVTNSEIAEYSVRLRENLSEKSVADVLGILKGLRKFALCFGYPVGFSADAMTCHWRQKQIRVLSTAEERTLYEYLRGQDDAVARGILLCMYTGIRIGELCALKWDDISMPEQSLRVNRTMQRLQCAKSAPHRTRVIVSTPKSDCSIRTIPLPDCLMPEIQRHYLEGAYILTDSAERFIEPRTLQYRFKNAIRACGLPNTNFHALRHTFATRCVETGFDIKSLSEILGHANVHITMNRYVHPSMEMKRANMEKAAGRFFDDKIK